MCVDGCPSQSLRCNPGDGIRRVPDPSVVCPGAAAAMGHRRGSAHRWRADAGPVHRGALASGGSAAQLGPHRPRADLEAVHLARGAGRRRGRCRVQPCRPGRDRLRCRASVGRSAVDRDCLDSRPRSSTVGQDRTTRRCRELRGGVRFSRLAGRARAAAWSRHPATSRPDQPCWLRRFCWYSTTSTAEQPPLAVSSGLCWRAVTRCGVHDAPFLTATVRTNPDERCRQRYPPELIGPSSWPRP